MPLDPRKRQKALARKAAQQSQRRAAHRREAQIERDFARGGQSAVRKAASWPVHQVLISADWEDTSQLIEMLVARRGPQGQIMAAVFLVDLACLGVKNAFARGFDFAAALDYDLGGRIFGNRDRMSIDLNLAAKILRDAVAYARDLGFAPNPDYYTAALLLGDANPDASPLKIPLGGKDGKPFFVSGPDDNVSRIISTLTKKLGPAGFEYLVGTNDPRALLAELPNARVISAAELDEEDEEDR